MQPSYVSVGCGHASGIDTAMAVWLKSVPLCLRHCGRFQRRGARPEREGIPGLWTLHALVHSWHSQRRGGRCGQSRW